MRGVLRGGGREGVGLLQPRGAPGRALARYDGPGGTETTRETRNVKCWMRNPKHGTRNTEHETQNPKPHRLNPTPHTRNPKPETRNPKTKTLSILGQVARSLSISPSGYLITLGTAERLVKVLAQIPDSKPSSDPIRPRHVHVLGVGPKGLEVLLVKLIKGARSHNQHYLRNSEPYFSRNCLWAGVALVRGQLSTPSGSGNKERPIRKMDAARLFWPKIDFHHSIFADNPLWPITEPQ